MPATLVVHGPSMGEQLLGVKNIKISVKATDPASAIGNIARLRPGFVSKRKQSFFVLRPDEFVYCIYYSGHINVTGLKRLDDVRKSCLFLRRELSLNILEGSAKIDNITSATEVQSDQYFNLTRFVSQLAASAFYSTACSRCKIVGLCYNKQVFPGAFIRTDIGTILFFNTNKVVCVGTKTLRNTATLQLFARDLHRRNGT